MKETAAEGPPWNKTSETLENSLRFFGISHRTVQRDEVSAVPSGAKQGTTTEKSALLDDVTIGLKSSLADKSKVVLVHSPRQIILARSSPHVLGNNNTVATPDWQTKRNSPAKRTNSRPAQRTEEASSAQQRSDNIVITTSSESVPPGGNDAKNIITDSITDPRAGESNNNPKNNTTSAYNCSTSTTRYSHLMSIRF